MWRLDEGGSAVLVIKCGSGSCLRVGQDIKIRVSEIVDGDVRLDVDCPSGMVVQSAAEERLARALSGQGETWDVTRMFAVAAKARPELVIGSMVRVTVTVTGRNSVHLGIDAPRSLRIEREDELPALRSCADVPRR